MKNLKRLALKVVRFRFRVVETTRLALQRAPLGDGEARKSRNARACIVTAYGVCLASDELVSPP